MNMIQKTKNKKKKKIKLLPHNKIAYSKAKSILKKQNKTSVVQPTGTGKSYIISSILSDHLNKKALVLAPSNFILENLKENAYWAVNNTIFMTYSKLIKLNEKELKELSLDLIILDEFHRTGAEKWGESVRTLISIFPAAKILGTSATPIRYLDNSRDMSMELFGKENEANNLSLETAIVKKILPMPKYVSSLYTVDQEISNVLGKIDKSENSEEEKIELKNKLGEIRLSWESTHGVSKIFKKHIPKDKKKFIVFCKDKEHLYDMEWLVEKWFKKAGFKQKIEKYRVISEESSCKKELQKFKDNKKDFSILFCIDMLNEGLHLQDVDVAILLRKTKSGNIFYQQIGRVLDVNKKTQPIIIDLVNNFLNVEAETLYENLENELKQENQKREKLGLNLVDIPITIIDETLEIKELLSLLQSKLTTSWDTMYEELKEFKKIHEHLEVPKRLDVESHLGYWVQTQRQMFKQGRLSQQRIDKLNEIEFVWDTLEAKWQKNFLELEIYIKKNEKISFTKKFEKESSLPQWYHDQLKSFKKGKLSQERIDKLTEIGVNLKGKFESLCDELREYIKENDHFNVPTSYKGKNGLGQWVASQRKAYSNGTLSSEKIQILKEIGFSFNPNEEAWSTMFKKLEAFKEKTNTTIVRKEHNEKKLFSWSNTQRFNYKNNTLSEEKLKKLEEIGFVFNILEHDWLLMFSELEKYYKKNKHSSVPAQYKEQDNLGSWVAAQRQIFKDGKLSENKIGKLNSLKFDWDPFETLWEKQYKELQDYEKSHGHSNVPMKSKGQKIPLGKWSYEQRRKFKEGKLSEDKIQKLNKLNFSWEIKETPKEKANIS